MANVVEGRKGERIAVYVYIRMLCFQLAKASRVHEKILANLTNYASSLAGAWLSDYFSEL